MALKIGDKIPEILGINQDNEVIKASDYRGKKLVLYFYPKDNTSGCTAEACSLRDNYSEFCKQGYEVVGVSVDDVKSHKKFIEKQQLPFNLIADTDKTLVEQFGVWTEKSMYGKKYMGTLRTTFIIDEQGIITRIYQQRDIKTASHGEQIMNNF
ncbi:MAG: thioredoxin-dependent thiol peroxidase [Bacteroidales bacterium]|jgi:peroxiredoxin Q/BCP|nr:thioredoxin-dependent thiol peroxidase [Bacteroidales bacterium]